MKNIMFALILMVASTSSVVAQKLMIGEKAPDMKIKEWLPQRPATDGKAQLIEFFHSSSKPCVARLETLDKLADTYKSKMTIVVLAKEDKEIVLRFIDPKVRRFTLALDDAGRTFTNYNAQFVPFSVIIDKKGRITWFGNASAMTTEVINSALE